MRGGVRLESLAHLSCGEASGTDEGGRLESTDGVDPLGFGNVSPKSPGELQKTSGSESEGHSATPRSGTGPGEGMGENQAAQSGRDGGLGEKSGGGAGSAVTYTAQMEME
eukprot:scaffold11286_cov71-Phaeocystis_antarctica.AAC.1